MSNILSILAALLILCVFVFVHELGHFLMGRALGFKILEFAIGMGPVVFKTNKNGIQYSLRALPIGGMCQFYGEDQSPDDHMAFNAQKPWKRLLVLLAGPLTNIVLAVIFAIVTLLAYGDYMPCIDSYVSENTVAEASGLLPGDIIYAIDGVTIVNYSEVTERIRSADGTHAVFTVNRKGDLVEINVENMYNEEEGHNYLGVYISAVRRSFGFFEAVGNSVRYVGSLIREMLNFFGSIFTSGIEAGSVSGPVGTISYIGQAVRMGLETLLRLIVLIGVNLGVMNLLPLPALDGGRIVFVLIEMIRRKPIKAEREGMVHFIGIILLFALMIYLTFSDISQLFGGG